MTILTALLVLVGVGAFLSRGGEGDSIFGGAASFEAKPDSFTLRAGRVQSLDVLLNDRGVERIDPAGLALVQEPNCGFAIATNGVIQYSDSALCEGSVVMSYCVPFEETCDPARVTLNILKVEEREYPVANDDGSPVVFDIIQQGNAPREAPQIAMKQPMRLTIPTNAEVVTPAEAAEDIRRLNAEAGPAVEVANVSDTMVTVNTSSARAGSVSMGDMSMAAPEIEDSGLDVALAAPRPQVPSAPRGMQPGGLELSGPAMSAPSAPRPAAPAVGQPAAPAAETELALVAPGGSDQPAAPQAPSLGSVGEGETSLPSVGGQPAAPATGETEIAAVAPDAQDETPDALAQPVPETPEESGVLASLARSNTVFGATVSAAKALFAPDEPAARPAAAPATTSAPRPRDAEVLAGGNALVAPQLEETATAVVVPTRTDAAPGRPQAPAAPGIEVAALDLNTGYTPKTQPSTPPSQLLQQDATAAAKIADPAPAPAAEAPETEVAALTPLEQAPAAVEATEPAPVTAAPAAANCGVDMTLQVRVGAEIVASLATPCRPEQRFVVDHAGLTFTAETDIDGVANFVVPAMQSNAIISATFPDGASAVARAQVENMSRMTRVAVMWDQEFDLDLHAREFGAPEGGAAHIWAGNASDYRNARRAGGGYLTTLGVSEGEGLRAEVYTIFESSRTPGGVVDLDLKLAGVSEGCPNNAIVRTLRSESSELVRDRDVRLNLTTCEANQELVIGSTLRDISVARN